MMSKATPCLVIIFDTSDDGAWLLESAPAYTDVWKSLAEADVHLIPIRDEKHQVFELTHPLTAEQFRYLDKLKQEGDIDGWYVRDAINH
jgi:hypothetical protein